MPKKIRSIEHRPDLDAKLDPDAYVDHLLYDKPIAFKPILAELIGNVNAALMLSQALYWDNKPKQFKDGFFWKSASDWQKETCLTRHEQVAARKLLRKWDFWKEELRRVPATVCFKVDLRLLKLALRRQFAEKRQTGLPESGELERHKPAILNAENRQTRLPKTGKHLSLSESTSENSQKARSLTSSQDTKMVPVEDGEKASRPILVPPDIVSEQAPSKDSKEKQLRDELYRGIYRKKIEDVIIDSRRLSFAVMFHGAATEAALSLCTNRSRRMLGISYKEIAAIVERRLAPSFPTFEAIGNFDSRLASLVAAIVNATIDAAMQLTTRQPAAGVDDKQKAFGF